MCLWSLWCVSTVSSITFFPSILLAPANLGIIWARFNYHQWHHLFAPVGTYHASQFYSLSHQVPISRPLAVLLQLLNHLITLQPRACFINLLAPVAPSRSIHHLSTLHLLIIQSIALSAQSYANPLGPSPSPVNLIINLLGRLIKYGPRACLVATLQSLPHLLLHCEQII